VATGQIRGVVGSRKESKSNQPGLLLHQREGGREDSEGTCFK
jgi:hypothetical protein